MNVHSVRLVIRSVHQCHESLKHYARTAPDEKLVKARRRQIFLAACRVLARKSFHEASVKELALEAGVAAGSIYLYLDSKDEIIPLIGESMVAELVEMLPAIRERTVGDPRRELIDVMRAILDVIDRYREAFNVLHHEARYLERRPQYRTAMKKIGGDYLGAVAEIIERGRRTRRDSFRGCAQRRSCDSHAVRGMGDGREQSEGD